MLLDCHLETVPAVLFSTWLLPHSFPVCIYDFYYFSPNESAFLSCVLLCRKSLKYSCTVCVAMKYFISWGLQYFIAFKLIRVFNPGFADAICVDGSMDLLTASWKCKSKYSAIDLLPIRRGGPRRRGKVRLLLGLSWKFLFRPIKPLDCTTQELTMSKQKTVYLLFQLLLCSHRIYYQFL